MAVINWDAPGEKTYETGVDHGVLYLRDDTGEYAEGYPWNGLTAVTESPSGAEPNKQYADNKVYLNLISAEEFGATVEAFTYPDEFGRCDGTAEIAPGVEVGQQNRETFGLSYRTKIGNDVKGQDAGYKLHLVYGALAAPSEKNFTTVNDSPEAMALSWELSTTPIDVPGLKPTALVTVNSLKVPAAQLKALEDILYGTATEEPRLPLPEELAEIFGTASAAGVMSATTFRMSPEDMESSTLPDEELSAEGEAPESTEPAPVDASTDTAEEPQQ